MGTAIIILLGASASAAASGQIVLGPVEVAFENGRREGCLDPGPLCLAGRDGTAPSNTTLDARQDVSHVVVRIDDGAAEDAVGIELLPDGGLVLETSRYPLRYDVFKVLVAHVGSRRAPAPLDDFGTILTEERYGLAYYGPSLRDPRSEIRPREWDVNFSDKGLGYERTGPFSEWGNTSTDHMTWDLLNAPCLVLNSTDCRRAQTQRASAVAAVAPNVVFGLSLYQVGVRNGDDPDGSPDGSARAPVDAAPPARAATPPPGAPLDPGPRPTTLQRGPAASPVVPPARAPVGPRETPTADAIREPAREAAVRSAAPAVAAAAAVVALAALAAALYSRYGREEALENERRLAMVDILDRRGPLTFANLGRALGVDRSTVLHHARLLQRTGHVRIQRAGKYVYAFLPGQTLPADGARDPASDALMRVLRERGGIAPRHELHDAADGYPARSRNHAIQRLVDSGLVQRTFEGNVEILRLAVQRDPRGT